jgi:CheY-like chemotaxis protein
MAQEAGAPLSYDQTRLVESRAQFIANLGRRLEAVRQAVTVLERTPRSPAHRDNLRRRVHALGAAAGVLGFDRVQAAFNEAEGILAAAAQASRVTDDDLARVSRILDLAPSLALGGSVGPAATARSDRLVGPLEASGAGWPLSVLVVASASLGSALGAQPASAGTALEFHHTENASEAFPMVQTVSPDVVVVDIDRSGGRNLIDRMLSDASVDPVHVVAIGAFERPEAAAGLVALGVARVMPKPVGPETLRRTILEVARERLTVAAPAEPLGEITVEALAERVAREVRRGLVDAVKPLSRGEPVPLGEGTEALAAVWGAVARLRELVTMRSGGAIRFEASGPEGAVPLAPWSPPDHGGLEMVRGSPAQGLDLSGRVIVVADDDPSIVWFLGGLLSAAGARVIEAHDGQAALSLTREHWPDLVLSDILMPELDGFSLCREIKRDLVLADVPVILLSWKEDLLQRVRELGADAEGYLRKESSSSTVLERVQEALWPHHRLRGRLAAGGEVRGRLDGLTPRTLLQLCCSNRTSVQVTLRDSAYLFEAQLRDGTVRSVARIAAEGETSRGERALAGMLGVRSGRFVVREDTAAVSPEFEGELASVIADSVRRARMATQLLSDPALFDVARVVFDDAVVAAYSSATPRQIRSILSRLAAGARPVEIVESGVGVALLESVLLDQVRHGGVTGIFGLDGVDRLATTGADAAAREALSSGVAPIASATPATDLRDALAGIGTDTTDTLTSILGDTTDVPTATPAPVGPAARAPAGGQPHVSTDRPRALEPKLWAGLTKRQTPAPGITPAPASGVEHGAGDPKATGSSPAPAKRKSLASLDLPKTWSSGAPGQHSEEGPPSAEPSAPGASFDELFDDGQAFAALLEGAAEPEPAPASAGPEPSTRDSDPSAASRAAPETKTAAEPSPFAAAFDRLGAGSPFEEESVEASAVDEGWSIVVEDVSPPAPAPEYAAAHPEDRMTREMPPGAAPPAAAFRSAPPGPTAEAVDLADGLASALAGSPNPPAAMPRGADASAHRDSLPEPAEQAVLLAPSKKLSFPKGPPRPSHPPIWAAASGSAQGPLGQSERRDDRSALEPAAPSLLPATERSTVAGTAAELARAADAPAAVEPVGPSVAEESRPLPLRTAAGGPEIETNALDLSDLGADELDRVLAEVLEAKAGAEADDLLEAPLAGPDPATPGATAVEGDEKPLPGTAAPGRAAEHPAHASRSRASHPRPTSRRRRSRRPPQEKTSWPRVVGLAVLTILAGFTSFSVIRAVVDSRVQGPAVEGEGEVSAEPASTAPSPAEAPPASAEGVGSPPAPGRAVEVGLELPEGLELGSGKGLLDLETGDHDAIYVDGVFVGRGPARRVPIAAGTHEVRLRRDDEDVTHTVEVRAGTRTRLAAPPAP